jgi:hypothetical protein
LRASRRGDEWRLAYRFFVGTLTFNDPSVADEAVIPNFSNLNHAVGRGNAVDNRFTRSERGEGAVGGVGERPRF